MLFGASGCAAAVSILGGLGTAISTASSAVGVYQRYEDRQAQIEQNVRLKAVEDAIHANTEALKKRVP